MPLRLPGSQEALLLFVLLSDDLLSDALPDVALPSFLALAPAGVDAVSPELLAVGFDSDSCGSFATVLSRET